MIKPFKILSRLVYKLSSCIFCQGSYNLDHNDLCDYCNIYLNQFYLNKLCNNCHWPIINNLNNICSLCITDQNYKFYHKTIAFAYTHPIDKLIYQLKYNNSEHIRTNFSLQILSYKLLDKIKHNNTQLPEVIIPVPIHNSKLKQRGFNQAIEVGRILSKKLNIKLDPNLLSKFKNTQAQASLDREQRMINLEHSFCFNNKVKYKSVAIIDDVVTTGATVHSIAMLLDKIGVEQISLWALARRV